MSEIQVITTQDEDLGEKLSKSFSETGFAALRLGDDPADIALKELVARCYETASAFFSKDAQSKLRWAVPGTAGQRGFTPFGTEHAKGETRPDLKEFLQFGRDGNHAPADAKKVYEALYFAFETHAYSLMDALAPHVGISLAELWDMRDGDSILRIIHYPSTGPKPAGIRAAPHEDINLITILPAASAAGLQVLAKDGSWIAAPTDPDLLILNVGDMLQELTGGTVKSTTHRVVNTKDGETTPRFSMPFFLHPPAGFRLSDRYPRAGDYLDERLREIGLKK